MTSNFNILQPIHVPLDDDISRDGVAGLELIERRSGLDDVGHDHRIHETGDGIVVDDGYSRFLMDRNDPSLEGITLGCELRARGGWLRRSAAAAAEER